MRRCRSANEFAVGRGNWQAYGNTNEFSSQAAERAAARDFGYWLRAAFAITRLAMPFIDEVSRVCVDPAAIPRAGVGQAVAVVGTMLR